MMTYSESAWNSLLSYLFTYCLACFHWENNLSTVNIRSIGKWNQILLFCWFFYYFKFHLKSRPVVSWLLYVAIPRDILTWLSFRVILWTNRTSPLELTYAFIFYQIFLGIYKLSKNVFISKLNKSVMEPEYHSQNRTKVLTIRKYQSQNRTIVFCV
jgi:hypothetical protein